MTAILNEQFYWGTYAGAIAMLGLLYLMELVLSKLRKKTEVAKSDYGTSMR